MLEIRREYPSEPQAASAARKDVEQFAAQCGLEPQRVFDVTVAVGEAIAEAIRHSRPSASFIRVDCSYLKPRLTVTVWHYGDDRNSTESTERGFEGTGVDEMGTLLMETLMDDVLVASEADDGARVVLQMKTS
jgi:anti-sigma regulatory factor (Ser/Thr protein kinase)